MDSLIPFLSVLPPGGHEVCACKGQHHFRGDPHRRRRPTAAFRPPEVRKSVMELFVELPLAPNYHLDETWMMRPTTAACLIACLTACLTPKGVD